MVDRGELFQEGPGLTLSHCFFGCIRIPKESNLSRSRRHFRAGRDEIERTCFARSASRPGACHGATCAMGSFDAGASGCRDERRNNRMLNLNPGAISEFWKARAMKNLIADAQNQIRDLVWFLFGCSLCGLWRLSRTESRGPVVPANA